MNSHYRSILLLVGFVSLFTACSCGQHASSSTKLAIAPAPTTGVAAQRIIDADATPGEWLSHGRTYAEQRFSPLDTVNDGNVAELGLAWYADLPTDRGIETTPLMADGKLFITASWGHVLAYDAKTGEELWHFDPKVPKDYGVRACCDAVNRGAALWGENVYAASLDGHLRALNRDSGEVVWDVDTRINTTDPYTITGAPRVVNGKVIIGNGGAEMSVRGYVTAYDAQTGKQLWRFYTVPGNPSDGFEDKTQQRIATTWTGEWWKNGKGGGTAWDSFAFDPDLNLLYIGVGNGSSWNRKMRSPGGGDNLFLSSIVALNADSGEYVWHYQTTPGDTWDYTATQHMILAELEISGQQRKVLMQAPKNGFFYVLDRATGELLSADKYMPVNWASHVNMETGRPVEAPGVRDGRKDLVITPGPTGAHNWHPMTFNPDTGLVYIPAKTSSAIYADDFFTRKRKTIWQINFNASLMMEVPDELPAELRAGMGQSAFVGKLIAWDPVHRQPVWEKERGFYSGSGLLSTQGNLIFQGDLSGNFSAFAADSGEELWSYPVQGGVMASPITYALDGVQYIAVAQGWGGETGVTFGAVSGPQNLVNISRVLVFRLGAQEVLPDVAVIRQKLMAHELEPPGAEVLSKAGNSTPFTVRSAMVVMPSALDSYQIFATALQI
jgi:quinohemoprotein ethanol dehydrogenase